VTQTAPTGMLTPPTVLCAALELSVKKWKLAFTNGLRVRVVTIDAGDWSALEKQTAAARARFEVPEQQQLFTCYEAGRDGFWIHRELAAKGIQNVVVDSSSIQVSRRARRAKTDRLDAESLAMLLVRHVRGEKGVWQVVRVPTVNEEDARRLHRERERLTKERTGHTTRLKSLLALHGMKLSKLRYSLLSPLLQKLPSNIGAEVVREMERLVLVEKQLEQLAGERLATVTDRTAPHADKIQRLEQLKALGPASATILVSELFGWRKFQNGKQVGACAGLAPTPYASGQLEREQGISKAGNKRVRTLCVEIAWGWLRFQPDSALTKWFNTRFAKGQSRSRRLGIVALARKLLVALWRYLEFGEVPNGAIMKA
jgi:transposase